MPLMPIDYFDINKGDCEVEIYEQKPHKRTIEVGENFRGQIFITIPVPYIVYIKKRYFNLDVKSFDVPQNGFETLHVAFKTEPIDKTKALEDQKVLMPPLPHIASKWFLVCVDPEINHFWQTPFGYAESWTAEALLKATPIENYTNWSELTHEKLFGILNEWPKKVNFRSYDSGFNWSHDDKSYSLTTTTTTTMGAIIYGNVHPETISYINGWY
jgi:hypothetical protein